MGFSIRCDAYGTEAKIFLNGRQVRRERIAPFYISGNYKAYVVPWRGARSGKLECRIGGKTIIKRIVVGC